MLRAQAGVGKQYSSLIMQVPVEHRNDASHVCLCVFVHVCVSVQGLMERERALAANASSSGGLLVSDNVSPISLRRVELETEALKRGTTLEDIIEVHACIFVRLCLCVCALCACVLVRLASAN